ncbi:MAG TPA: hypothetical protein VGI40_01525 [Pirellulaceae bacterium]|jgi:hypothetical protein
MRTLSCTEKDATVVVSCDEVEILNNAINEVCNALDAPEFSTRMGADISEVRQFLEQIHALGVAMQNKGLPATSAK